MKKILIEINSVQIDLCHAEQFSKLLDGLEPLLADIQSKEAGLAVDIIELLWIKRVFSTVENERIKFFAIFKEKQLGKIMKEAYLNESTP